MSSCVSAAATHNHVLQFPDYKLSAWMHQHPKNMMSFYESESGVVSGWPSVNLRRTHTHTWGYWRVFWRTQLSRIFSLLVCWRPAITSFITSFTCTQRAELVCILQSPGAPVVAPRDLSVPHTAQCTHFRWNHCLVGGVYALRSMNTLSKFLTACLLDCQLSHVQIWNFIIRVAQHEMSKM